MPAAAAAAAAAAAGAGRAGGRVHNGSGEEKRPLSPPRSLFIERRTDEGRREWLFVRSFVPPR